MVAGGQWAVAPARESGWWLREHGSLRDGGMCPVLKAELIDCVDGGESLNLSFFAIK